MSADRIREIATYFQGRQQDSEQIGINGEDFKEFASELLEIPPVTLIDMLKTNEGPDTHVRFVKKGIG